ncbi:MAG: TIGR02452 family protein [Planctomycetia bacterium]|nr:TIGR02452 family protein [Planctomycetia bacterium]
MSTRKTRALIAAETVAALELGEYRLADHQPVSIQAALESTRNGTRHYAPEDFAEVFRRRDELRRDWPATRQTQFQVVNATTLAAAKSLVDSQPSRSVVCLNFASAKNPGGGFLGGSQAQEESLARATGLYASLLRVPAYYEANRACHTCLYTEHMIYSPAVPVLRDDQDAWHAVPHFVSMITSPAVNAGAIHQNEPQNVAQIAPVMRGRMERVLSVAAVHQHTALVLGAWGCGVFRNDPTDVATWFHEWLCESPTFQGAFETVVFAVLDRTEQQDVIRPFQKRFCSGAA